MVDEGNLYRKTKRDNIPFIVYQICNISREEQGKVSFATIVATSFMRSITSFAVRQHRFPTANENDICAFGAKWCSSLRSEIRPYGSWSPWSRCGSVSRGSDDALCRHSLPLVRFATLLGKADITKTIKPSPFRVAVFVFLDCSGYG